MEGEGGQEESFQASLATLLSEAFYSTSLHTGRRRRRNGKAGYNENFSADRTSYSDIHGDACLDTSYPHQPRTKAFLLLPFSLCLSSSSAFSSSYLLSPSFTSCLLIVLTERLSLYVFQRGGARDRAFFFRDERIRLSTRERIDRFLWACAGERSYLCADLFTSLSLPLSVSLSLWTNLFRFFAI